MSTTRQACRSGGRFLTSGALGVFLAVAAPAAGAAAASYSAGIGSPAAQQPQRIICAEADVTDLPHLSARQCDSVHWGPISYFVVIDRDSNAQYDCENGWSEGGLWLRAQKCRGASTGS
ncbi:hypothetical protein AB0P17_11595 [Streptomyces sp. NPDC088124]|uniref:hypothetical protein n=1 Tax=Streptomyces sp. NPDC088124 TaxID=3154654 RepID=UPI0034166F33